MKHKLKCKNCGNTYIVDDKDIQGIKYIECPKCKTHRINPIETQVKLK
jgi:DNA-directed RNA polymerase subunit RPC12/RpoP